LLVLSVSLFFVSLCGVTDRMDPSPFCNSAKGKFFRRDFLFANNEIQIV
jgi:arginine/ornithine N-succinyltransferase beta subunit